MKTSEETIALRKERNMAINAKFTEYLKQGMGFMDAYEKTARDFLSFPKFSRQFFC